MSPGSKRHGEVPNVKVSTSDIGIIKLVNSLREHYKTDGKEKAKFYVMRKRK